MIIPKKGSNLADLQQKGVKINLAKKPSIFHSVVQHIRSQAVLSVNTR